MLQAIDVAISHIGIREATGKNDGEPADLYMDGQELAWCAGAVIKWFAWSDSPDVPGNRWLNRNVRTMWRSFVEAGMHIGRAIIPERNDVVFFNSRGDSDAGDGWHCGIVEAIRGHEIHTVEGNVSDSVARRVHRIGDPRIIGYGRPTAAVV